MRRLFGVTGVLLVFWVVTASCGADEGSAPAQVLSSPSVIALTPSPAAASSPTVVTTTQKAAVTPGSRLNSGTILDKAIYIPPYELDNLRYGGSFNIATSFSAGNLDPKIGSRNLNVSYAYDRLIERVADPDSNTMHLGPVLAEKWEMSADLKTYTFYLRKGIKFHNIAPVNGREMVSSDVVFSFKRYMEKDSLYYPQYEQIESIEAPDKYVVVMKLKNPNAWALGDMFDANQYVVPPEITQGSNPFINSNAIGTGPYILKDYQFRRDSFFTRNPQYWGKDNKGNPLPYTDQVRQAFVTEAATIVAGMRTGQLDGFIGITTGTQEQIIDLGKSLANLRVYGEAIPTRFGIAFNTKRAPWNDVNVRRALNMALDKERFIDAVVTVKGNWEWAGPIFTPLVFDHALKVDDLGPYYKYNSVESKKLRVAAGFPDGKIKIGTPLLYGFPGYHVVRAPVLKELLKAEGIDLEIQAADRAVFQDVYYQRSWQDLGLSFQNSADPTSVNWYAVNKFAPDAIQNSSFIDDPTVNKTISDIRVTTDQAKLRQLAKVLWDFETLGSWVIWMPAEYTYNAYAPRIRNHTSRAGGGNRVFIWLADAPRTIP